MVAIRAIIGCFLLLARVQTNADLWFSNSHVKSMLIWLAGTRPRSGVILGFAFLCAF